MAKIQQEVPKNKFTDMATITCPWEKAQEKVQKVLEKQKATKKKENEAAKPRKDEAKKQKEAEKAKRDQTSIKFSNNQQYL